MAHKLLKETVTQAKSSDLKFNTIISGLNVFSGGIR